MMRITPYRTADHIIRGAVIEFVATVTDARGESDESSELDRAVLACLPGALAVLDDRLCITWGNQAFLELVQVDTEVIGRPFEDLWGGATEQPTVWKLLEEAGSMNTQAFQQVRTTLPFGQPANQSVRFSARRLLLENENENDQRALILIAIELDLEPGGLWTTKSSPGTS
jgi:PAS domain-containing protein